MERQFRRAGAARGLGSIMLAAVLWGTVGVTTQALYAMSATTPLSIGFLRLALASVPLLALCRLRLGRGAWRIQRRDLGLMLLAGAMLALYQVCFFAAIPYAGVAIATLITLCSAPVLVALLSAALLRERLGGALLIALSCAVAGTLLIGLRAGADLPPVPLAGVLLALVSGGGYATITICGRLLASRCHPLQTVAVSFASGALLLGALSAGQLSTSYPAAGWLLLLYLGLIPSALAYALFLSGMRSTTATGASIATLVEPLTATLLAGLLFHEQIGASGLLGALLLLGAMALLLRGQRLE